MDKTSLKLAKAKRIADAVHGLQLSKWTAIIGTSNPDTILLQLRKTSVELAIGIHDEISPAEQLRLLEATEAGLQTAQLTGLITNNELDKYLKEVDDLHELMDKE